MIRAQRKPPTRPPRWPPTLIPLIPKVSARLIASRMPSWEAISLKPRPRAITKVAPKMPKIAPEAPTVISPGLVSARAPKEPASSEAK